MAFFSQHFDDPTLGDPAAPAFLNHARQFGFQSVEPRDTALHGHKMLPRNGVHSGTGSAGVVRQRQQGTDTIQREAQLAAVPDEGQPVYMLPGVGSMVSGRAGRDGQNAGFLVIADRLDFSAGERCQIAYGERGRGYRCDPLEPLVATGSICCGDRKPQGEVAWKPPS
jgi:hypothetical protein